MAVIDNANTPEAVEAWHESLKTMPASNMVATQLVQRGAEDALARLLEIGVNEENLGAMLAGVRQGLFAIHEAANARGIQLLGYQDEGGH